MEPPSHGTGDNIGKKGRLSRHCNDYDLMSSICAFPFVSDEIYEAVLDIFTEMQAREAMYIRTEAPTSATLAL